MNYLTHPFDFREDSFHKSKTLVGKEVLELEPNLSPVFDAGVIYDYAYHARDLKEITKKLFELYLKSGGKFKKEEIEVDVVISSQAAMKIVGQLGQVLGPKGLMPNPKTGTVTEKVGEAINNAKSGQVRFRTDKNGILHGCIGKVSFSSNQIQENAAAMLEEVKKLKPATAKGAYIQSVALSSTMGPGVKVAPASLVV